MSDIDSGIFDAVAEHNRDIPALQASQDQKQKDSAESAENKQENNEEAEQESQDSQTFSRDLDENLEATASDEESQDEVTGDETQEPSKQKSETKTEDKDKESEDTVDDWKSNLAPPPQLAELKEPEVNEEGKIVNMTPQEYEEYLISKAEQRFIAKQYDSYVLNTALDAAEAILPEIKTNPTIRTMIENIQVASVVNGQSIDAVEAARQVKDLIGGAKAEGAQNAKTSIEIQQNSAIGTGSGQRQVDNTADQNLARRLKRNEPGAMEDLMELWMSEGKV